MTPAILDNSSDHHDSPSPSSPIVSGRRGATNEPIAKCLQSPGLPLPPRASRGLRKSHALMSAHVLSHFSLVSFFLFLLSTCFLVPSSHFISYFLLFADVIIPFSSLLTPLHCCHIPVLFPREFSVVIFPFSLLPTSLS